MCDVTQRPDHTGYHEGVAAAAQIRAYRLHMLFNLPVRKKERERARERERENGRNRERGREREREKKRECVCVCDYVCRECCSVLQCIAVCCGVLQSGAVCCSVLQCVTASL